MNAILEIEVVEINAAAVETKPVVVELDLSDLGTVGGGFVSPCFA